VYRRNELSDTNISKRQAYLFEIEQLDQAEAIIICCDEKAYHFGGTPNQHKTLPANTSSYQSCALTRFKLEQWAAACGDDCSVKRPWTVWELRDQTSEELQKQLDECNDQAKKITEE
jgi:hypothetical protein